MGRSAVPRRARLRLTAALTGWCLAPGAADADGLSAIYATNRGSRVDELLSNLETAHLSHKERLAAQSSTCSLLDTTRRLGCREPVQTDCTSEYHLPLFCPEACPFAAVHSEFTCVFECTIADECSTANPELAFPNNLTHVCEPCEIVGCRTCSAKDICQECFENFLRVPGGRVCAYVWDDRATLGVHAALALGAALVLAFIATVFLLDRFFCGKCLPQESPLPHDAGPGAEEFGEVVLESRKRRESVDSEFSMRREGTSGLYDEDLPKVTRSINQGRRHRLRCKIKEFSVEADEDGLVHQSSPSSISRPIGEAAFGLDDAVRKTLTAPHSRVTMRMKHLPLWVNLRSRFLVGVGLPLFHQWYLFLALWSLMMAVGSYIVFRPSKLSGVLQRTGFDYASHVLLGGQEKILHDEMALCDVGNQGTTLQQVLKDFAERAAVGYFILWMLGLLMTLAFAARQKHVAREFHRQNPCLAEFAVLVEGFPPDAVDDQRIERFLRDCFKNDTLKVSVCYNYRAIASQVHELMDKVLVFEDVNVGTYDITLTSYQTVGLTPKEREEIASWFRPGSDSCLRNSGSVFVIFPHFYDLQQVKQHFSEEGPMIGSPQIQSPRLPHQRAEDNSCPPMLPHQVTPDWILMDKDPLWWVGEADAKMHKLKIRDVFCEPPDVVWEYMGISQERFYFGIIGALLVILGSFLTFAAVVFVPLAAYSANYVSEAGSLPAGAMMTLFGTLQMSANWVLCILHIRVSNFVGFRRRDREAQLVFQAFVVLVLANFFFGCGIAMFPDISRNPMRLMLQPIAEISMEHVSFQAKASVHLFHCLMPGSLFIGYLLWPLQGFVWPFVSSLGCLQCMHGKEWMTKLSPRQAEHSLESLGLSLGHDYMGHIVQPVSCCLLLFFASGVAWQTFICLACWSLFMIPFMRYLHLRAVKRCFSTTSRLDTLALYVWGAPLSMVLGASCFWAARLRAWPMQVVLLAWLAGNFLYGMLLAFLVRPLSPPKDEGRAVRRPYYDEVRSRRFYDWHNCNPIAVLRSHAEEGRQRIIPFQVGKEYLQVSEAWMAKVRAMKTLNSNEEEHGSSVQCDWQPVPGMYVPEVETLLHQPLRAIGRLTSQCEPGGAGRAGTRAKHRRDATARPEPASSGLAMDGESSWSESSSVAGRDFGPGDRPLLPVEELS